MGAGVLPISYRISRDFRALRAIIAAQAAVASVALPFIVVYADPYKWLITLAVAFYAARKIGQFVRNDLALKQIRLEERFYRQQMDGATLARCVRRSEHLWDESYTLRGLRAILARPIPRIISSSEKERQVEQKYAGAFRGLLPPLMSPEVLLPMAGIVWLATIPASVNPPTPLSLSISVLALLVALEALSVRFALVLRRGISSLMRALSQWTLAHSDFPGLVSAPRVPYRHDLLYRADPVYSAGVQRRTAAPGGS